jgi:hypothetical protein
MEELSILKNLNNINQDKPKVSMEHFIWLQTSISVVTYFLGMRGKTFPIKNLFAIVTYLLVNHAVSTTLIVIICINI